MMQWHSSRPTPQGRADEAVGAYRRRYPAAGPLVVHVPPADLEHVSPPDPACRVRVVRAWPLRPHHVRVGPPEADV